MAHEVSETYEEDGRWVNVRGKDKRPLEPRYPFEKRDYDTRQEAEDAAMKRSEAFGREVDRAVEREDFSTRSLG